MGADASCVDEILKVKNILCAVNGERTVHWKIKLAAMHWNVLNMLTMPYNTKLIIPNEQYTSNTFPDNVKICWQQTSKA